MMLYPCLSLFALFWLILLALVHSLIAQSRSPSPFGRVFVCSKAEPLQKLNTKISILIPIWEVTVTSNHTNASDRETSR
jgi:uncharacterized membrane protein YcgQ (UPF0703/DUF1980 family)